jgi:hypothetical protein
MKNIISSGKVIVFAALIYLFTDCSKSSSSGNNQCNFSTGSATAAMGAQVTYSATGVGNASLSSVTYQGVSGQVVVRNPSLPWSVNLNFSNGGNVSLSAVGSASSGATITLSYGITSSGSFSADTVACGH